MPFLTAHICNPGGRFSNEDYLGFISISGRFCWVLSDGLGGHRGGEIASRVAVNAVLRSFKENPSTSLNKLVTAAQIAVVNQQKKPGASSTMRSTLVVLLSDGRKMQWAHIGDSRLYRFRNDRIIGRTKDHSVPQALADAGDIQESEIRHHIDRNRLLRSLGGTDDFQPSIIERPCSLKSGDTFLICSDGFWEPLKEIELIVELVKSTSPEEWLRGLEHRLLERIDSNSDNYSALGVFWINQ